MRRRTVRSGVCIGQARANPFAEETVGSCESSGYFGAAMATDTQGAPVPLSRNRDFQVLWISQALSSGGQQISTVAFPLLVLGMTGSATKAGLVGTSSAI